MLCQCCLKQKTYKKKGYEAIVFEHTYPVVPKDSAVPETVVCDGDAPSRATTVVDGRELIPSPTAFNATTLNAYVPRRKFEILERRKKKKKKKKKKKRRKKVVSVS